ncbi:MAG: hypothetical protein AAF682_07430 [Planctomycetota bacterium]
MFRLLIPLACLFLAAPAPAVDELVDREYSFRLESPGKGWKLLDEQSARGLVPDAVAGLVQLDWVYGVVVPEHAPGAEFDEMADLIRASIAFEGMREERYETIDFQGRDAVRLRVSGLLDGIRFRHQFTIFTHGDYVYQIVCWAAEKLAGPNGEKFAPILDAFTLLEEPPVGRRAVRTTPDAYGVGWRVQDGVFESAAYGVRVAPEAPWYLAVGPELAQMNASAEVALIHEAPDLYFLLLPDRVEGLDGEAVAQSLRDDFLFDKQVLAGTVEVEVAGEPVPLTRARYPDQPLTFLHGAFVRGGTCYQALLWFHGNQSRAVTDRIAEPFAQLDFLTPDERAALRKELAGRRDPDNAISESQSLRNGVYRDFELGLTWTKPEGLWRALIGQAAREEWNNTARLVLEEPARGLNAALCAFDGDLDEELASAHATSRADMTFDGDVLTAPEELTVGGRPALASTIRTGDTPEGFLHRIVTIDDEDRFVELVFYGLTGNVEAAGAAADAVLAGLDFTDPPPPAVQDGVYRDEKVGFTLQSPGEGWSANTSLLPAEFADQGGSCSFSDGKGREVFAIGASLGGTLDPSTGIDLMLAGFTSSLRGKGEETDDALCGIPCRRKSFRTLLTRTEILVAMRESTVYVLGVSSRGGSPTLEEARGWFGLLP